MSKQAVLETDAIGYRNEDGHLQYADKFTDGQRTVVELPDSEFKRLGEDHEKQFGYPAVSAASRDEKRVAAQSAAEPEEGQRSPANPEAPIVDEEAVAVFAKLPGEDLLKLAEDNNVEIGRGDKREAIARKLVAAGVSAPASAKK